MTTRTQVKTFKMPCGTIFVLCRSVRAIASDGAVLHDQKYRSERDALAFAKRIAGVTK